MMTINSAPPAIRACLFDMDGLLIDSEDLYTLCTNEVLLEYGRPSLPWSIKAQMQGRPGPAASAILHDWAQLPISREEYMAKIQKLQREYFPSCKPLPGVPELLETLSSRTEPRVHIALATSSHALNFKLKTDNIAETFAVFAPDNRVLGDDKRIPPGRGKPAPDIYMLALETLNVPLRAAGQPEIMPAECLVFEDSVPGVESGRRAGMQVVWCPHKGLLNEFSGREEEVLAGLTGEYKEQAQDGVNPSPPGKMGDGWGRLLLTLEDFPYESYKIHVSGASAA